MDVSIFRLVIVSLGLIGAACIGGVIYLSAVGKEPQALSAIASAAVGSLVGILAIPRPVERPPDDKTKN